MSDTIQDKEKQPIKIKTKKPSLKNTTETTTKINLNKKEDAVQEQSAQKVDVQVPAKDSPEVESKVLDKEPSGESVEEKIASPITEIALDNVVSKDIKEVVKEEVVPKMPENIEKLINFMEDTGGSIEDYTRLNRDYSVLDEKSLLKEYYKNTKPHLNQEEIDFIMEDNFSFDEEVDEERAIKKKKLAFKEEIAKATNFLEETKSKYYDEIKLRPGVTQEQKKATDFFNRYNKGQEDVKRIRGVFEAKTNELTNEDFKGFEFNVGDKKFNYNADPTEIVEKQSNLDSFFRRFLNKKGEMIDPSGYHKAIYAARNADTIANHFYEQGKADAVKDVLAKSNNIENQPRAQNSGEVFIGGLKVKAVNGVDSSKLKFKTTNKNKN
eukprot:COSAG01_NODE_2239_length_8087_cov_20.702303_2_plen_381_part_00